jgi:hypothetical protein
MDYIDNEICLKKKKRKRGGGREYRKGGKERERKEGRMEGRKEKKDFPKALCDTPSPITLVGKPGAAG